MVRDQVIARSGGHCEAMVRLRRSWTRCGRQPVEVHHMLTRARGGDVLDEEGETEHLVALCPQHHRLAHNEGVKTGMMIQGYAYRDGVEAVYEGSNESLKEKHG